MAEFFFCQTPDNFQSETELSFWTTQIKGLDNKKLGLKRIGQNKTGLIELSHF